VYIETSERQITEVYMQNPSSLFKELHVTPYNVDLTLLINVPTADKYQRQMNIKANVTR
jgi:hypothetical protein